MAGTIVVGASPIRVATFDFSRVSDLFPRTSDTNVVSWVSGEVDQAGNVSASGGHDEQAPVT